MPDTSIIAEWTPHLTSDRRLLKLHTYWLKLCRNGDIPLSTEFLPVPIRDLQRLVFLVDVLEGPRDFRYRQVGEAVTKSMRQDISGRRLGDVFPPAIQADIRRDWSAAVARRQPRWARGPMWALPRDFLSWKGVILPLRSDAGDVVQLVGAAVYGNAANWKPAVTARR